MVQKALKRSAHTTEPMAKRVGRSLDFHGVLLDPTRLLVTNGLPEYVRYVFNNGVFWFCDRSLSSRDRVERLMKTVDESDLERAMNREMWDLLRHWQDRQKETGIISAGGEDQILELLRRKGLRRVQVFSERNGDKSAFHEKIARETGTYFVHADDSPVQGRFFTARYGPYPDCFVFVKGLHNNFGLPSQVNSAGLNFDSLREAMDKGAEKLSKSLSSSLLNGIVRDGRQTPAVEQRNASAQFARVK
jgi:hypothetical protein